MQTGFETQFDVTRRRYLSSTNAVSGGLLTGCTGFFETSADNTAEADDNESLQSTWIEPVENDDVGQQLTAVKEGNIVPSVWAEQGPIINSLSTEVAGQPLYLKAFGEFLLEEYPNVPEESRLFGRQRVADIINGDLRS